MNKFEPGDRIGDKAGNAYLILDRQLRKVGTNNHRSEYLLRRESDNAERWISEEIVDSFSFMI